MLLASVQFIKKIEEFYWNPSDKLIFGIIFLISFIPDLLSAKIKEKSDFWGSLEPLECLGVLHMGLTSL